MIRPLIATIVIEGIVVFAYCRIAKKPTGALLVASLIVNAFTQTLLWVSLGILFRFYMAALLVAEALIWFIEGLWMHRLSKGELKLKDSFALSFYMNLASFGCGLILPI